MDITQHTSPVISWFPAHCKPCMKVPLMADLAAAGNSPEILFWVGCAGSFDQRAQKITRAFATILNKLSINYAILGKEEACTGDPVRRAGNEFMYKLFFDMKKDVTELKKMFVEILHNPGSATAAAAYTKESLMQEYPLLKEIESGGTAVMSAPSQPVLYANDKIDDHIVVEESLNIMDKEKELIEKALKKHKGKRKDAASDLGISERTLYRKLKEYNIEE